MDLHSLPNIAADIARMIEQFKLPGVSATAVLEERRKDIDALSEANRIAVAGVQGLAQKQSEILRHTLQELQSAVQAGGIAGVVRQPAQLAELVQKTLQTALTGMRDVADITVKSQSDALGVVNRRLQQTFDELKGSLVPPKA